MLNYITSYGVRLGSKLITDCLNTIMKLLDGRYIRILFAVSILSMLSACINIASTTDIATSQEKNIQYLMDRTAIEDVVKAYALSMDTRDWELHRSIFTEQYKLFRRGQYIDESIEDRISRLDRFTNNYLWTQHLASIYSIEIDGDKAFVISTLNANHKGKELENGRRSNDYLMIGHYHYWLERAENGWKIYQMQVKRFRNPRSSQ